MAEREGTEAQLSTGGAGPLRVSSVQSPRLGNARFGPIRQGNRERLVEKSEPNSGGRKAARCWSGGVYGQSSAQLHE